MPNVHAATAQRRFIVVSFFAGGGGSCIGFGLSGGKVILANEFVPEAIRTYSRNFPYTAIDPRNIREIAAEAADDIDTLLARVGVRRGQVDIVGGSPPCNEFCTLGRGPTAETGLRRYSDVLLSGSAFLPKQFFRLAALIRPKVVIAENVPALGTQYPKILQSALNALRYGTGGDERRYFVNSQILNAADFGVAQARRRLIMIGVRMDVGEAVGIQSDDGVQNVFPRRGASAQAESVRSALAGLQQGHHELWPWRKAMMLNSVGRVVRNLPHDPEKLIRPRHVGLGEEKWFTLVRCAWDLPSPTLTCLGQQPNGLGGALHPADDRKFTIPELKRLFALPDDYALTGTLNQAAERICRMVPPPLIKAVADSVYDRVLQPYAEARS